ncbi:MAG: ComF family protein [candidate division Zixibacteria bacterium]|nr:ComF family protein [candidate division Zixibacteria bacterium]
MDDGNLLGKLGLGDFIEFVFPSLCLVCDQYIEPSGELICPDCWGKAIDSPIALCSNCMGVMPESLKCPHCSPPDSIPILALGHYVDPLKKIIHQFKYYGYKKLSAALGNHLIAKYLPALEKADGDCIVPIPLDHFREKTRGFNQAAVLSDIISKRLNILSAQGNLVKRAKTKDQTRLDPRQRIENMKGAFAVQGDTLLAKRVILMDDVVTTGATLREAMKVILESGAKPVLALVVAATD